MPYNEKIRDTELRSQLADEGLSDEVVSKIFLEVIRAFFLNAENFSTKVMRNRTPALVWSESAEDSKVRIVRGVDWKPEDMGKTPEIVIRNQGSTWKANQVGGLIDPPADDRIDDPDLVSSFIYSRIVVWAISNSPTEARNIAWELGTMFMAYARPIRAEYGFSKVSPAGVGAPVWIQERKGYWGCPVVVATQWELTQELIEQQPVLAEFLIEETTLDTDYTGS